MSSSTSAAASQGDPKVGSITIYETDKLDQTTTGESVQSCSKVIIDVSWWEKAGNEIEAAPATREPSQNIQLKINFHIEHACRGSCPAIIPVEVKHVGKPSGANAAGWFPVSPEEELLFEVKWAHNHDEEGHHMAIGCVGVRWCTEKGIRNADGSRPWQTAEFIASKNPQDTASTDSSEMDSEEENDDDSDDENLILAKGIQDPSTIEGQREGAMLVVKRKTEIISKTKIAGVDENNLSTGADMQVGDCVEILRHSDSTCRVYNWRSGAGVEVPWNTFLPIGPREFCQCPDGKCRCVYVDFYKNLQFRD